MAYPAQDNKSEVVRVQNLLPVRKAAAALGISYSTLKLWIYRGKSRSVYTPGGHHRIPESEIERLVPEGLLPRELAAVRQLRRKISERNHLIGCVIEVEFDGLIAVVKLAVGEELVTSIITADAAKELRLKPGVRAVALIKSTEVMVLRV